MKKYIYHLLAATLLVFFVGCSEDDGPTVAPSVVGEWHLTTWNWGSNYTYEVNGDKLTTTSETSTAEVSVYTKTTIPDEVRNAPVVRSEATPADFGRFL